MILSNIYYKFYLSRYFSEGKIVEVPLSLKELPEEFPKDIHEENEFEVLEVITIDFCPHAKARDGIFRKGKYKGEVEIKSSRPLLNFFWRLPEELQLKLVEQAEAFLIKETL